MSIFSDIADALLSTGSPLYFFTKESTGELLPGTAPVDDPTTPAEIADSKARAQRFLLTEAALLGGVVAAPAAYIAYKGRKRGKKSKAAKKQAEMQVALESASQRATALLAAFGPAVMLPATYITVQKLEDAQIITKGLGDATQTLIAVAAAGQVASGIGSIVKAVI